VRVPHVRLPPVRVPHVRVSPDTPPEAAVSVSTLIVEDDAAYARVLSRIVKEEGFLPTVAHSGEEGLALLAEVQPALVLADLGLPGIDGVDVIRAIYEREPTAVCIVVSGLVTVQNAVAAMRAGAFDIIEKTADITEVQLRLRRAMDMANLRRQVRYLEERDRSFGEIVGNSVPMLRARGRIEEVAAAPNSTVLIVGETGTGKELVARAIHRLSGRRVNPLITINCAAIPDNLLESEFFGHERGAFTGADRVKLGLFETAHGGSLFLDEISELDLRLQAKLLRVIEERSFKRVGGVKEIKVDVRLIAATNKNLEQLVAEGRFREDLLYRLNVFQIDVPPLRERGDDVLLLTQHFLKAFASELGKRVAVIERDAEQALRAHRFPGNVRQLRNLVEQAVILARDERLTVDLLSGMRPSSPAPAAAAAVPAPALDTAPGDTPTPSVPEPSPVPGREERLATARCDGPLPVLMAELGSRQRDLDRFEREVLERALREAEGNKTRAAELLGISRYAFLRSLRRLD
jgi:DNA-binding NtrC family response regulator